MSLTREERLFLQDVQAGRRPTVADRQQDKMRQKLRRSGLAEVVMNPRRWVITDAGRAALQQEQKP